MTNLIKYIRMFPSLTYDNTSVSLSGLLQDLFEEVAQGARVVQHGARRTRTRLTDKLIGLLNFYELIISKGL